MWKKKIIVPIVAMLLFVGVFSTTNAAALTESQIQAIIGLLGSFGADQATITNVNAALRGSATVPSVPNDRACLALTLRLYKGMSDANTRGEVSKLQEFLLTTGDYTHPVITGYFGAATEVAVQRFQMRNGIVTGGTAATTGFGSIGSSTRSAMARCGGVISVTPPLTSQTLSASPTSGAKPLTVTFASKVPGNAYAGMYWIDFGDGATAYPNACSPSTSGPADSCGAPGYNTHTYTAPGTYIAVLYRKAEGPGTCSAQHCPIDLTNRSAVGSVQIVVNN